MPESITNFEYTMKTLPDRMAAQVKNPNNRKLFAAYQEVVERRVNSKATLSKEMESVKQTLALWEELFGELDVAQDKDWHAEEKAIAEELGLSRIKDVRKYMEADKEKTRLLEQRQTAHLKEKQARHLKLNTAIIKKWNGAHSWLTGIGMDGGKNSWVTRAQSWMRFVCWLRGSKEKNGRYIEQPPELDGFRVKSGEKASERSKKLKALRQYVLEPEDIDKMTRSRKSVRDRAFIMTLYGGGFRIGEVMGLCWRDIEFIQVQGAPCVNVRVTGKTGTRSVTLTDAAAFLADWKDKHPKPSPEEYLWVN